MVDNDEVGIAEAWAPLGATWRSAVDRCPANLEHSPAAAPLACAWTGASAGGGTLRGHKIGPDDAGTVMYALFMVVNHAWRCLLAQGGGPKSTASPFCGGGSGWRVTMSSDRHCLV